MRSPSQAGRGQQWGGETIVYSHETSERCRFCSFDSVATRLWGHFLAASKMSAAAGQSSPQASARVLRSASHR